MDSKRVDKRSGGTRWRNLTVLFLLDHNGFRLKVSNITDEGFTP